ncbi:MAG: hypothetical protein Q4C30_00515 [Bacteroidia bacterium]|nr:hypothetical protein [Bacteroidia bacterium]
MKKLLSYIFFLSVIILAFSACKDDDDEPAVVNLPVNYANLSGEWQLVSWRGEQLPEGVYFKIDFDRRDHIFTIRQNLNSMYEQQLIGSYSIELQDDDETYLLSGSYAYGKGDWEHSYIISSISVDGTLSLVAADDASNTAILKK